MEIPKVAELPIEDEMDTIEPKEDMDLKKGSKGIMEKFRRLVGGSKE